MTRARDKFGMIGRVVRAREFWLVGIASIVLLALAFQIPYSYKIDFGAHDDRFVVRDGMYDGEAGDARTFRWTSERARLVIPAVTRGAWDLQVVVNGWQPEKNVTLRVRTDEAVFNRALTSDWLEWKETLDAANGDLNLVLRADTFQPSQYGNVDTRALGVRVDSIVLTPANLELRAPPFFEYVLPLTLAVMLCFLCVSVLQVDARVRWLVTASVMVGFVAWIFFARVFMNQAFGWTMVAVLCGCFLFAWIGLDGVGALYRRAGIAVDAKTLGWLGLIVLGFFALKVLGSVYPQMYVIDALFHEHRLAFVEQGNFFFVTRSREFGSLETVYPPALYIFLAPLGNLLRENFLLLRIGIPLMEAVGGLFLFAAARKGGMDARAALFAVFLYLGAPLAFITFGWGVYANVFAQQLCVMMLAVWFVAMPSRSPQRAMALLSFFILFGVLAHASMLLLLAAFWFIFIAGHWLAQKRERARAVYTALAVAIGFLVAFGIYFSFFVEQTLANVRQLETRAAANAQTFERVVGGGLDDRALGLTPVRVNSVGAWLAQGAWYFAREGWVYYRALPILLGLVGVVLLWRNPAQKNLALCLSAGFATVLIFFLVGLVINLYTRYMLFGAPFFALGAGYTLNEMWTRGNWLRLAVIGILGLVGISGVGYWLPRIVA